MASKAAKLEIQVDAETKSAIKDLDRVSAAVDDISTSAADAGAALGEIAEGAAGAAEAAGDSFGGIVPVFDVAAVLGKVGELASKAGEFFADKFSQAMDFEVGVDKLQVQLGLTATEAGRLGKMAGDIYAEAWGDSIADVNEGLASVIRNIGLTADASNLKTITTQALALSGAFDIDLSGLTRAAGVLRKVGFAGSAEEALDLITRGLQTSSGEADDFVDNIIESSATLKTFGFTGKQALGLVNQGMKAGAENAETVTGLFQELTGNVASGGDDLKEIFDSLGIDSAKVIKQLSDGGPDAAEGIDTLLDALRNIEDPLARNAAIAGLFGEEGAAIGAVLEALDAGKAAEELGEVAGAAQAATDALGDNAAGKLEAFKRSMEVNVTQFIVDNVIPTLNTLGTEASRIFTGIATAWDSFVMGFQGQKPLELGIDDGHLTDSIGAVEEANKAEIENPALKTIRELGEEFRKLTDEYGPKVLTFFEDLRVKLEQLSQWFAENQKLIELLLKVGFVGILVVGGLVVIQLGIIAVALALLGLAFGIPVAGIILLIDWFNRLDQKWKDVFGAIVGIAVGPLEQVGSMIGTLVEIIENLTTGTLAAARGDWATAWDSMWETVKTIAGFITSTIDRLVGKVKDLINALTGASSSGMGVGNIPAGSFPRSALPAGLMVAPMTAAAQTAAPAPVFNITIAHSGLAVDSPRLQREIVDAIRRYEKREGLIRNPNALAAR